MFIMDSKVEIRASSIQGSGVFALQEINRDDKVFRFSDRAIKIEHKQGCNCYICKRSINIAENLWLYPKKDSFGWNLNHSCNPSCYILGKDIFAFKKIKRGDEITIDYSTTNIDKKWKMKCSCGSKNCRKIIRSVQFLPKTLFKKYKGHMPRYMEESYKN